MRLSLSQQFMLAMVGLSFAVLLPALVLARWSFERGLEEYVGALERRRLSVVAQVLLGDYDARRGWDELTQAEFNRALRTLPGPGNDDRRDGRPPDRRRDLNPGRDRDRNRNLSQERTGPSDDRFGGRPGFESRPGSESGPGTGPGPGARPGPGPRDLGDRRPPPDRDGPRRDRRPPTPPESEALNIPTALFDETGQLVLSYRMTNVAPGERLLVYPLTLGGQVVGELRSLPRQRLKLDDESAFLKRQGLASIAIFATAVLLSLIISFVLARRLTAPLRKAHGALSELASGNYGDRMDSVRGDELGDLMRDIDTLSETLEQNQGARRRWIADISHELRTPIAILKGELEAMADGIRSFDRSQLTSLQAEVARLAKLVDDLYQLSLADLGGLRYEFQSLVLANLLKDLFLDYEGRLSSAGLMLNSQLDDCAVIRGDAQRLIQLFRNLLENSLAYTDSPGSIDLSLGRSGDQLELIMDDSAPGVPLEDCGQLFEPLYRRDASRNRRREGAGLGLAICRAVVDAHEGTITAEPSPTGGLRVRIRLPLREN